MTDTLHLFIFASLAVMTAVLGVNLAGFRRVHPQSQPRTFPRVSVLIPARNEGETLERCLRGLAAQEYPDMEIIVLDDHSTDATESVARAWEKSDSRVRLVQGAELPGGWVGKSYACHQLAQHATGDLLLFVDADTVHAPGSITGAVAAMERTGAGLLSLIPHQTMVTFWEKVFLPLLHFSTMCFLPFPLVSGTRSPRLAMANGQFMLFDRRVYNATGGHAAVRTALVEDVWLARLVKSGGHRLVVMDGGAVVSCRMYRSLREIWAGFSKNLFAGFQYSVPALAGVMAFNALTSVLPFLLLPAALVFPGAGLAVVPAALEIAILVWIRVVIAARFRQSFAASLLHPVAVVLLIGIAVNSCRWVISGGGSLWKGRRYDFRPQTSGRPY